MKHVLIAFFVLFSSATMASGFDSEIKARSFADSLMNDFVNKNFKEGLNKAKPHWPIPMKEVDTLVDKIIEQWPIVDQRFGKAISQEFVKEKRIGKSFLRYYYLHKFENHSIYWQFDFYKPRDKWIINAIKFLDSIENLYD